MDQNTRDVLVVGITVLGTLGGIIVGAWLQGRHRHDDEKRRVYSRIIGLVRETTWALGRLASYGPIPDVLGAGYVDEVGDLVSVTQLLGGKKVVDAAQNVHMAMTTWLRWDTAFMGSPDEAPDAWRGMYEAATEGLDKFIVAAQQDLGLKRTLPGRM
jgi:hypothetical protein